MLSRSRPVRRLVAAGAIVVALGGCKRRSPPKPDASALASARSNAAAFGRGAASALSTPTAFDLVPSPEGATLAFVAAATGSLLELDFDGGGSPATAPKPLFGPRATAGPVFDVAAAWVGERLALAWVERQGDRARVRATLAPRERRAGTAESPIVELGPAWLGPRTARGNVAVAPSGDHALVFARGEQAACLEPSQQGCFGFRFDELSATGPKRRGLPLTVPVPCVDDSALLAVVGDRFHYGVCTDTDDAPVTTLFTIERSPEYARADRLLQGCRPLGLPVVGSAVWLVGQCDGSRRAVRVGKQQDATEYLDLRSLRVACDGEAARLRAPGLDLALDEPRGSLGPLLPAEIAPPRARAVWTGRALLVAASVGETLGVTRFVCRGGKLERDAVALPAPGAGGRVAR